ncbi:hypothetical protein BJX65DRAFT_291724 [Aspergillus insuetus]
MVRLLKDAGAIPYVKTAIPVTLLPFETSNGLCWICESSCRVERDICDPVQLWPGAEGWRKY